MTIAMFMLLLFLGLIRTCSAYSVLDSTVCGDDMLAYRSSSSRGIYCINGNQVGKSLFCEALQFYYANGCKFHNYFGIQDCGLDLSLADPCLIGGRKLLQTQVRSETPANGKDDHRSTFTNKKVDILVPGVFVFCCLAICPCFYRKRKENTNVVLAASADSFSTFDVNAVPEKFDIPEKESVHDKVPQSPLRVPPSPSRFAVSPRVGELAPVNLTLNQIMKATRNFSPLMQIGEGGFGTVYKAQIENGMWVAIKRAKQEHFESLQTEFSNEVELLAKIEHQNLVKLLGYVDKGNERLIITEYVPNGTLREHLDGSRGRILDFAQRLAVAIDIAHGLTYLHLYAEKQIIHRDVKSSNILLTDSMRAKVADFGFARLGSVDADKTHVSTKVKGTVGYLDPEYMKTYQLTPKSDVYSFGILLVEMLTGRRPVELKRPPEERITLRWAFPKFNEGCVVDLVDRRMEEAVDAEILFRIFDLAFQCAAPIRSNRPDMQLVGEQLWGIRVDYLRSVKKG